MPRLAKPETDLLHVRYFGDALLHLVRFFGERGDVGALFRAKTGGELGIELGPASLKLLLEDVALLGEPFCDEGNNGGVWVNDKIWAEFVNPQTMLKVQYRKAPTDKIELYWQYADHLSAQASKAVYLFRKKGGREILYIGKAYRQSIRQRWECSSKNRLEKLARKEKIELTPLVAGLHTTRRLTPQLVGDVERMLIFLIQPRWNGPGAQSCSLHHNDLFVKCSGNWTYPRTIFEYESNLPHLLYYLSR